MYADIVGVRQDLSAAHRRVWDHVASVGSWWTAAQRLEAASIVLAAFDDTEPLPPWVPASTRFPSRALPPHIVDAVYRMAAHAQTLTPGWYAALIDRGIAEPAYVELCGVVMSVSAVASFARSVAATLPPFPPAGPGLPDRHAPELARSPRNWVPVTPPGGRDASVVEALSAAPGEFALLWDHLAPTQYMADHQMADLAWTRGTLSRPQAELLAGRVASLRQCFF